MEDKVGLIYKVGLGFAAIVMLVKFIPYEGVVMGAFFAVAMLSCLLLPGLILEHLIGDEVIVAIISVVIAISLAFWVSPQKSARSSYENEVCKEYGRYGVEVCK